jgi:hypothetical protein
MLPDHRQSTLSHGDGLAEVEAVDDVGICCRFAHHHHEYVVAGEAAASAADDGVVLGVYQVPIVGGCNVRPVFEEATPAGLHGLHDAVDLAALAVEDQGLIVGAEEFGSGRPKRRKIKPNGICINQ